MSKKKSITVSEWVTQAIKESKKIFMDCHFDIFKDYENPNGLVLLQYACNVLREARFITFRNPDGEKFFNTFIYIPFEDSRKIKYWHKSNWLRLGEENEERTYEPPSLCLLEKGKCYFNNIDIEEYRCPIIFPSHLINKSRNISALFCCFRDPSYIDDEFYSRIYLYYKGTF